MYPEKYKKVVFSIFFIRLRLGAAVKTTFLYFFFDFFEEKWGPFFIVIFIEKTTFLDHFSYITSRGSHSQFES
jgi:hypothetical protein